MNKHYSIVLRARIQSMHQANLQHIRKSQKPNVFLSQYITIGKRNRRIFKGHRLVLNSKADCLNGNGQSKAKNKRFIDMWLFSNDHLNVINANNIRKRSQKLTFKELLMSPKRYCTCNKIKNMLNKRNARYLITARVVKTENIVLNNNRNQQQMNESSEVISDDTIDYSRIIKRNQLINQKKQQLKQQQLIYLTYVIPWHKARRIVEFLDDDAFDVNSICKNRLKKRKLKKQVRF